MDRGFNQGKQSEIQQGDYSSQAGDSVQILTGNIIGSWNSFPKDMIDSGLAVSYFVIGAA